MSEWYHRGKVYWTQLIGLKFRNSSAMSINRGELNYVIYIGKVKDLKFFHRGVVLQARFLAGKSPGWIQSGHWDRVYSYQLWLFHFLTGEIEALLLLFSWQVTLIELKDFSCKNKSFPSIKNVTDSPI